MVPTAWESVPLPANGKVDRQSMPEPEVDSVEYVAPQTETEKVLCEIWQDVLGIERVSVNDNFFRLCRHSILDMRLVNNIKHSLSVQMLVRHVFQIDSLREQASYIDSLNLLKPLLKSYQDKAPDNRKVVTFHL